jgi:predicted metal-dependent HD superfamily phosphohydrolase
LTVSDESNLTAWFAALPFAWTAGCDVDAIAAAKTAYGSPGRHYHTWNHVLACLGHLETFAIENPRPVFLAIVFHDAVYVPGRQDNETESARFAHETLAACAPLPDDELASIERMILATQNHHASAASLSADEATMLDIDLSILASPRDEYARYAKAIRDEYCPVVTTDLRFRIGRREFLEKLAAAPHIYLTAAAQRRWDDIARENLQWESAALAREQNVLERAASAIKRS